MLIKILWRIFLFHWNSDSSCCIWIRNTVYTRWTLEMWSCFYLTIFFLDLKSRLRGFSIDHFLYLFRFQFPRFYIFVLGIVEDRRVLTVSHNQAEMSIFQVFIVNHRYYKFFVFEHLWWFSFFVTLTFNVNSIIILSVTFISSNSYIDLLTFLNKIISSCWTSRSLLKL